MVTALVIVWAVSTSIFLLGGLFMMRRAAVIKNSIEVGVVNGNLDEDRKTILARQAKQSTHSGLLGCGLALLMFSLLLVISSLD